jgi:adenylyl-sulfate kinase
VTPARRQGLVLWLTGLSGAGKSTLAIALGRVLAAEQPVEILDGDEIRAQLSSDLTFSKEDRDRNVRRIGFVARLLARNGVAVVVAAISPYADARGEVRAAIESDGVLFLEVHIDAALPVLIARDPKGLYRRAQNGELPHFTGISDPYEPPAAPDVLVRSDHDTVEDSVERVLARLRGRRGPAQDRRSPNA